MDVASYFDEFTRRDWQTIEDGTVRIAVVALGNFARNRGLPGIRDSDFCEATVLVSGSSGKAEAVAADFGIERLVDYDSYHNGVAADAYDAVYVASPPAYHREFTETAARLGKHVLCEKPLAANVSDAERMIDATDDAGVTLMTAYRLRTEPAVRRMREMIQDGVIGDPVHIKGGFSTRLLDNVGPDNWRLDPDVAGGGALMDLGVYPLNVSRFLLDSDPVSVWAETTSRTQAFERVDEHVAFQLSFPDGTTAACSASYNAFPTNRMQVLGTDAFIVINEPFGGNVSQDLTVEQGENRTHYTGPSVDEVREEFDYFAHCVLTGEDCETDGQDGLTDLRAMEAAYESAETGRKIEL